ncbi:MAG: hypothetical protein HYY98_12855 [Burkholderiales bacterium]|jgi:hypothetical protein|nr:hypothetical protein [Burkholderiales bacterium]
MAPQQQAEAKKLSARLESSFFAVSIDLPVDMQVFAGAIDQSQEGKSEHGNC